MKTIFRQNQRYTFLLYCNDIELNKEVLDCGAGGNCPPLAIFDKHRYKTHGIDIDPIFHKLNNITYNELNKKSRG